MKTFIEFEGIGINLSRIDYISEISHNYDSWKCFILVNGKQIEITSETESEAIESRTKLMTLVKEYHDYEDEGF